MKTRPILFNGPMVRALLNGTKTQTRRVAHITDLSIKQNIRKQMDWSVKFSKPVKGALHLITAANGTKLAEGATEAQTRKFIGETYCPYGRPGDRLWVREAWARTRVFPDVEMVVYREGDNRTDYGGPWKPGIHMLRRDSRITLGITEVRVERLQDISEADALAEGIVPLREGFGLPDGSHFHATDPRQSYLSLWEAINGPGSVEANPWVWPVSLKRLEGGDA